MKPPTYEGQGRLWDPAKRVFLRLEADEGRRFRCGDYAAEVVFAGLPVAMVPQNGADSVSEQWIGAVTAGERGLEPALSASPEQRGAYDVAANVKLLFMDKEHPPSTYNGYPQAQVIGPHILREE